MSRRRSDRSDRSGASGLFVVSILAMDVHRVTAGEVDAATNTIAHAFLGDPVWRLALGVQDRSEADLRAFWRFYVEGALRFDTAYAGTDARTVSVWIPPGENELSEQAELEASRLVEQMLAPDRARAMFELWERFAAARPHDQTHAYLSLLATHPDHAGHGHGIAHLASDLERWDAAGIPTYLESTNPRNDRRYQGQGYGAIGRFETVLDSAVVTTMWRPVGG
jgi:GNAT superfamily N-acetyltransferase